MGAHGRIDGLRGASAFAAWSATPDRLTLARAAMGVGAAALMPCTLSILTNVFVKEGERVRAIGLWSGTAGLGVALGPVLGGFLLAHYWWGSVFLVNVPVAVVGLVASIWLVPNSRNTFAAAPDPVGALLSILGLGLLLWGIIEAPGKGWLSPQIMGAVLGSAAVITCFVLWERHTDHPMLPMGFFAHRRYSVAIAALALVLFALLGMFFLMTQYLQFVLGYSALEAGLRIAPVALTLLVIAPLSVVIAHRFGTKPVVGGGLAVIAIGLGLLSRTTVYGTYRDCIGPFVAVGIGVALALAPCTESVMGSLPKEQAGVGSATNDASMQAGGALGVGVLGTALTLRYQHLMAPLIARAELPGPVKALVGGSLGGALAVAQHAPAKQGAALAQVARHAFVSGMDLGLVIATGMIAVAAVLVVLLLPNRGSSSSHIDEPVVVVPVARV
jgi:EmrB/QacA subfamily drug resistance transporter